MGQRGERFLSNPVLPSPKARAVWTLQAGWTVEPVLCRKRVQGLPWWLSGKESTCRCQETRFTPWSRKIPRAAEQPSPCAPLLRLWPRVWEPRLLSPLAARTEARTPQSWCSMIRAATARRSPSPATKEQTPLATAREKPTQQRRPSTVKSK